MQIKYLTFASKCGIRGQMRMILITIVRDIPRYMAVPSFPNRLMERTVGFTGGICHGICSGWTQDAGLQDAFWFSGFFSGMIQKFLSIGGKLISLLDIFFLTFSLCVNQWGLVVGCVNFPQCLQGV